MKSAPARHVDEAVRAGPPLPLDLLAFGVQHRELRDLAAVVPVRHQAQVVTELLDRGWTPRGVGVHDLEQTAVAVVDALFFVFAVVVAIESLALQLAVAAPPAHAVWDPLVIAWGRVRAIEREFLHLLVEVVPHRGASVLLSHPQR